MTAAELWLLRLETGTMWRWWADNLTNNTLKLGYFFFFFFVLSPAPVLWIEIGQAQIGRRQRIGVGNRIARAAIIALLLVRRKLSPGL